MKKIIIEISRKEARKTSVKQAIKDGYFMIWTPEKIKNAFRAGHGTIKDFNRYKNDNKPYIIVKEYTPQELQALTPYYIEV